MRAAILIFCLAMFPLRGADFPPVTDFGPTNEFGKAVQRSMRLLADSAPEKKRTVTVLFYGQSVTQQPWFWYVGEDWLKSQFPNAHIIVTNRAIGYDASLLAKIAEADIMPLYPDLVIYQNYGPISDMESIIAMTRARTTADILLQTDHPTELAHLTEGTNATTATTADAWKNYVALPEIAERYGAELCDVRSPWKRYLLANDMAPADVLRDHIHPNFVEGDHLMTEFVKSYLRVDRSFSDEAWRDAERTVSIPREPWDSLSIPFVGNRVDIIVSTNGNAPIEVRIDGKRPSEFPELHAFSRPEFYPNLFYPCILQVKARAPLLEENWSATVLESFTTNGVPQIRFSVAGSKTGFDGEGSSWAPFLSNSGRVALDPSDWLMLTWAAAYPKAKPLAVGYEIKWVSRFYGMDSFVPRITDPALETTVTVAQGLANGSHILTLSGSDTAPVEAVRIYNPLARTRPEGTPEIRIEELRLNGDSMTIQTSGSGRYVVESAAAATGPWSPRSAPRSARAFTAPLPGERGFLRLRKID